MKYQHLFFDLDHTLWDFERSSSESLTEVYHSFNMVNIGVHSLDDFITTYLRINYELWAKLERGEIQHGHIRDQRFQNVLKELGIETKADFKEMEDAYIELLPTKPYLLDGALDVLNYVRGKGYQLHVLTNGFGVVQVKKMKNSGINHYFTHLITNEKAQARKPDPRIFQYALSCATAQNHESIMIGDNWEADIMGAKRFGIDTIYYNPAGKQFDESPTYEISHLHELMSIF